MYSSSDEKYNTLISHKAEGGVIVILLKKCML